MAMETRTDPRKNFVPRRLPWLLAAAMLVFYWLTLNRWVSLVQSARRGEDLRLDVAAGGVESHHFSGHLSVPLAARAGGSARAEFVFRRCARR